MKTVSFAIDNQDICENIYHDENESKNENIFRVCICGKKMCIECLLLHQLNSKIHRCKSKYHTENLTVARKCTCGKNICTVCLDMHILTEPEHNTCNSIFHNFSVKSFMTLCECGENICENCKEIHLITSSFHTNKLNNLN